MNVVPLERCFGSPGNIASQRQHGGSVTSPWPVLSPLDGLGGVAVG